MQQVNLNLVPGGVNPIVYASQNDDKRTIRFELVSGGDNDVYVLSGNETITAKITKPDGTAITIPITNPGSGKHYVDLVNGVSDYDQDGVYLGEVSITKGEKVLGTGNFVLKVEADPYDGSVQKKIVIDNPATFSTSLPDVLVSCKCKIDDANGIDSMDVINAGPTYARDSVPYQLRQTPITANRTLEKLIGVSCAFNQLVQNGNFSDNSNWSMTRGTLSVSDNIGTITINNGETRAHAQASLSLTIGHKYLIIGTGKYDTYSDNMNKAIMQVFYGSDTDYSLFNVSNNSWNTYSTIFTCVSNQYNFLRIYNNNVGNLSHFENIMCFDLTAMLGSEVADYLYTLESNTAGSGIALFKQLFPDSYYAYQTATLISSKPVAKKVVGINQWDEVWEVGRINTTTGENQSANDRIRSKNYIPCFGSTQYYWKTPYNGVVFFYDSNNGYLGYQDFGGTSLSVSFTTPNNARFVRFFVSSSYGTSYGNNISINYPSTDHDYHAYEEHTYPLGGDELRGLLKVENGQLVAYGDVKPSDGNGTEYFDIVDLGNLTWNYNSGTTLFYTYGLSDAYAPQGDNTFVANAICPIYFVTSRSQLTNYDKAFSINYSDTRYLSIRNTDYTDANAFKTAMNGVYLIYEKATPTAKSYTPFTNPMICGSTEEFTDSRSVKMFCGHDSIYADNISFAHIDFGQTVTDGTLDVVHGILTPTGGSPVSVTPASIKTFSGVNNVFSNGGGDITAIYLDTL